MSDAEFGGNGQGSVVDAEMMASAGAFGLSGMRRECPAVQTDVGEMVRAACESGTAVYPVGGGTCLGLGVWPTAPGIELTLGGLNRLIDYPSRDLTITVEAGMTMAELARQLRAEGQRLPIDVPLTERATIGGVIAANTFGPRRFRWGTIRDYLLGFTAVDGRGQVFSGGGRVVKNAAGYNMTRLLTGSLGTLGVLTQVTLMVRPIPQATAMVACDLDDLDACNRLLTDLAQTPVLPTAVELLAGPAWDRLPGLPGPSRPGRLRALVAFEGLPADVESMIGCLQERWQSQGIAPLLVPEDCCEPLWRSLTERPSLPSPQDAALVTLQINVLPSRVGDAVGLLAGVDPQCSVQAHAGDGVIRVWIAVRPRDQVARQCQRLRSALAAMGGKLVVGNSSPGLSLSRDVVWGPPGLLHRVLASLKQQFDPQAVLNRGRFVY